MSLGRLYRSGHFAHLAEDAAAQVRALDFSVIVDLRYPEERQRDRSPWTEVLVSRTLEHHGDRDRNAPHTRVLERAISGEAGIEEAYLGFYSNLPFDRHYRPLFARAVEQIAHADGLVLIHCSAGKDRTGMLVGFVQSLLGVSDDDILSDYLKTRDAPGMELLRREVSRLLDRAGREVDPALVDDLLGVQPIYIRTAFDAVRNRAGSIEEYFVESGVSPDTFSRLRDNYLTRAG